MLAPKEVVLPEDCLAYLINEKALLVGIQGLALAYQEGNLSLPREAWHLSFDRKEVLFDYVGPRVPYIYIHPAGQFDFDLLPFKDGCAPGQTLLCFT